MLADLGVDQDQLGVAELVETLDAEFAADTGELAAAERNSVGTLTHTMPEWISFTARMLSARSLV